MMFSDIVGYDSLLREDEKKAFDTRKKNLRIHKRLIKNIQRIFEEKGYTAAFEEMAPQLEDFVEKNHIGPIRMAIHYIKSNQPEKALDWIEKGFEIHDSQMIYITTQMYHFDPLFDNPRFIDIAEKMNLPLP